MSLKLVIASDGCCGTGLVPRDSDWEPEPCPECKGTGREEVDPARLLEVACQLRLAARTVESFGRGFWLAEPDHAPCCDAGGLPGDRWADGWDAVSFTLGACPTCAVQGDPAGPLLRLANW